MVVDTGSSAGLLDLTIAVYKDHSIARNLVLIGLGLLGIDFIANTLDYLIGAAIAVIGYQSAVIAI